MSSEYIHRFALERKRACKGPLGNNFGELGEVLDCLLFVFIFVLFCTALQVRPYDTKLPPNRTAKKYTTGQKTVMLTKAAIIRNTAKAIMLMKLGNFVETVRHYHTKSKVKKEREKK